MNGESENGEKYVKFYLLAGNWGFRNYKYLSKTVTILMISVPNGTYSLPTNFSKVEYIRVYSPGNLKDYNWVSHSYRLLQWRTHKFARREAESLIYAQKLKIVHKIARSVEKCLISPFFNEILDTSLALCGIQIAFTYREWKHISGPCSPSWGWWLMKEIFCHRLNQN